MTRKKFFSSSQIVIPAAEFNRGNLRSKHHNFGKGIVLDGGRGYGFAEYDISLPSSGRYELWSRYAAGEPRSVNIYLDGKLIQKNALSRVTGGWRRDSLKWFKEVSLNLSEGKHTLRLSTKLLIPHIERFKLIKVGARALFQREREVIYTRSSSLRLLREKLSQYGLRLTLKKAIKYLRPYDFINNRLDMVGVFDGSHAYTGPYLMQIDLTHRCNNNCIGCWCNSPLLGEERMDPITKQMELPYELVRELIDEIGDMGSKEIYFSGGGEPFMHPRIMDVLEYSKKKGMVCYVNTNFTLLNKERIRRLVDLGVDHLTISIWAGTAETYDATHPNKSQETFYQIRQNLELLNSLKKEIPYVKLYNVIFNMNYHEIEEMVDLALDTNSESVEFTMIDTKPGKTDVLLLTGEQNRELVEKCRGIKARLDADLCLDNRLLLFRFDQFLRRISDRKDVITGQYDRNVIDQVPCYVGWVFARLLANGDINPCLKAHRIPSGNLYLDNFKTIWNNEKQKHFRKKTLVYKKEDPFFRLMGNDPDTKETGCYKSCDDIGRNIYMHNRIMSLSPVERDTLRLAAKFKGWRGRNKSSIVHRPSSITQDTPLDIAGILNGRRAFIGPEHVVIDLTNRCNERCIGCWTYSPLLKDKKPDSQWVKRELSRKVVKKLIDELKDLGTARIRFTGGGEPFMHPDIMELIAYVKRKGLICAVTTNFSLVNDSMAKELVEVGLDDLSVSLWVGDAQTYVKTHPGRKEEDFYQIKENLKLVSNLKNNTTQLTLCNVILNQNYKKIKEMLDFAIEVKADTISFTVVDTIAGRTDSLMLSQEEIDSVLREITLIKERVDSLPLSNKIKLENFEGFVRRISNKDRGNGQYDKNIIDTLPCYVGWIFTRIMANGDVAPCCRAVWLPMGNINEQGFRDIWYGDRYNEFRCKAKYLPKSDPYFSKVGCYKTCDNLMHNQAMHKRIVNREE